MSMLDQRGVPVSTGNRASLARYEEALELFHGYFGNPLAVIDAAIAEDPHFIMGHCLRAGMLITAGEKALLPAIRQSNDAAAALSHRANDRERRHIAAARAWLDGDYERAVAQYGDILIGHPRDAVALQIAHIGDFLLGQSRRLCDRVGRVLPAWDASVAGYGYVLGMHAFGLEENARYDDAEAAGRRALELNRRDPWAVHAVAHVMEMQGRLDDGIEWLTRREADWAPDNGFAFHNWWHLALYHLERGEFGRVLELYDTRIRPQSSAVVLEMIDATSMLWRLHLRGVDTGDRWRELADAWEPLAQDAYLAFNDMHAMMSFVAAGRDDAADRLLASMESTARGTNAMMTREVGLPACRAVRAFGDGDFARAIALLRSACPVAHRFGGSHAQRDVLSRTLLEAAIRAGDSHLTRELAAERHRRKPATPFSRELWQRWLSSSARQAA